MIVLRLVCCMVWFGCLVLCIDCCVLCVVYCLFYDVCGVMCWLLCIWLWVVGCRSGCVECDTWYVG